MLKILVKKMLFKIFFHTFIKDFKIFLSYRIASIGFIFIIIANTYLFYYFAKLVDVDNPDISSSSYYIYVIYGLIISDFTIQCINRIPNELRNQQLTGVIEPIFSSSNRVLSTFIASTAFSFIFSLLKVALYIVIAKLFFGVNIISISNLFIFMTVLVIYYIFLVGISLLAASYTVLFKRGNPITVTYIFLSTSIGETFIPVKTFPEIFHNFSDLIPTKKALELLRSLENEITYSNFYTDLYYFLSASIICFALSGVLFLYSIHLSKKGGSLTSY